MVLAVLCGLSFLYARSNAISNSPTLSCLALVFNAIPSERALTHIGEALTTLTNSNKAPRLRKHFNAFGVRMPVSCQRQSSNMYNMIPVGEVAIIYNCAIHTTLEFSCCRRSEPHRCAHLCRDSCLVFRLHDAFGGARPQAQATTSPLPEFGRFRSLPSTLRNS